MCAEFFVVKQDHSTILGLDTSEKLEIIQWAVDNVTKNDTEEIVKEFPRLFHVTGCAPREYKIELHMDVVPVVQPARMVPLSLREPLRTELDRMEKEGIIQKVSSPTDWVSPHVIVLKKDCKLRVCMDPRCIKREHYQMPCREDIEADLADAKFFSWLDANAGFHQIALDKQLSKICTFATPFGRYRFLRLPFGIASASEVFQKALNEVFDGLAGVRVYVEDVLIWGGTRAEHDERLRRALETAEKAGLIFNASKCRFGQQEVLFLGDIISDKDIRPNPDLVDGFLKMPRPQDKLAVQRLLRVNYFSKYLPALSQRTFTLRSVMKHGANFDWTPNHESEWQAICRDLSNAPVLAIFDPNLETKVTANASPSGVGAALLQRHGDCWQPVAYASRALTESEQRYSQIEKEALASVFGCEKFNHFVYGRPITLESDHSPLIDISKKGISDMPPRVQ